jgi:hypothetical protein
MVQTIRRRVRLRRPLFFTGEQAPQWTLDGLEARILSFIRTFVYYFRHSFLFVTCLFVPIPASGQFMATDSIGTSRRVELTDSSVRLYRVSQGG